MLFRDVSRSVNKMCKKVVNADYETLVYWGNLIILFCFLVLVLSFYSLGKKNAINNVCNEYQGQLDFCKVHKVYYIHK